MSFERERVAGQGSDYMRGESVRERFGQIRERIGEKVRERGGHDEGAQNVGGYERVASGVGGAVLVWLGVRSRSLGGALMAIAGGALLYRGATGRCPLYRRLGIDTTREDMTHGVEVERSITVAEEPEAVYRFWRDVSNLPRFMGHLEAVQDLGGGRSRWMARGMPMEWDARIIEDVPGRRIVWQSEPGARIEAEHEVRFEPAPGQRGTEVRARVRFMPPGGRVGSMLARFLRGVTRVKMGQDLHRMKQILETGERTTSAMRDQEHRAPAHRAERSLPEEMRAGGRGHERAGNTGAEPGMGRGSHR